jgi:hypothetical protein
MAEPPLLPEAERVLAATLFNEVWALLRKDDRSRDEDDALLHMAHASRHHWGRVGTAANRARGEWQVSRVYSVLDRAEPCLHHARRALDLCMEHGLADWDLAFAHEALARGHAVAGDPQRARNSTQCALDVAIADPDDRALLLADLATIPGQTPFW